MEDRTGVGVLVALYLIYCVCMCVEGDTPVSPNSLIVEIKDVWGW